MTDVAPHFKHLNLMNSMVPLMMAPCDANGGVTLCK